VRGRCSLYTLRCRGRVVTQHGPGRCTFGSIGPAGRQRPPGGGRISSDTVLPRYSMPVCKGSSSVSCRLSVPLVSLDLATVCQCTETNARGFDLILKNRNFYRALCSAKKTEIFIDLHVVHNKTNKNWPMEVSPKLTEVSFFGRFWDNFYWLLADGSFLTKVS
jgi:hypothetical protein